MSSLDLDLFLHQNIGGSNRIAAQRILPRCARVASQTVVLYVGAKLCIQWYSLVCRNNVIHGMLIIFTNHGMYNTLCL